MSESVDADDPGFRGRSRSRSFVAEDSEVHVEISDDDISARGRSRSRSFVSENDCDTTGEHDGDNEDGLAASKAASLTKLYLKGSKPIDPNASSSKPTGKRVVKEKTGALSAQTMDVLAEGLQSSSISQNTKTLTEEELEERNLADQEAQNRQKEVEEVQKRPTASQNATAKVKSLASKASSLKSKMFSRFGKAAESLKPVADASNSKETTEDKSDPILKRKRSKLKILLLGDSGVGKTSLMRVFSGDPFSESMLATAGVDFKVREMVVADHDVTLQVWDTAGQERFHRITATYYKGADGIILIYDVSDKRGFDNVGYWMNNIRQYSSPKIPAMILVGNKIDLPDRRVTTEEGRGAANQYNCRFIETSAKTSTCVEDTLDSIAKDALYLSLKPEMSQKELIEKEKLVGSRQLAAENCTVS